MQNTPPAILPACPNFSSGPCAKRPGWTPSVLQHASLGRSHRARPALDKLRRALDETRELLSIPAGYEMAIVPGSDTGAVEMMLWSLLGSRPVDVLAWENFGKIWVSDIVGQLKLPNVRVLEAEYGALPDLGQVDFSHDVVFTYNGTTSGVCVPDCRWIDEERTGLTICDATSAIFAMQLDFSRLDVTTFSWQKMLGGEAGFGMVILSERALERLASYRPAWPLPKLFRLTRGENIDKTLFAGATINTPSLLCVEDYLDAISWAWRIGGLPGLMKRVETNAAIIADFVAQSPWARYLAADPRTRSTTSVCLEIIDEDIGALSADDHRAFTKAVAGQLAEWGAAFDIGAYRAAPPGFRIWCGATVESSDIKALMPWLDWAFYSQKAKTITGGSR